MELDDTAAFRSGAKWGSDIEFPLPFGRTLTAAERFVAGLDEATGARAALCTAPPLSFLLLEGGGGSR